MALNDSRGRAATPADSSELNLILFFELSAMAAFQLTTYRDSVMLTVMLDIVTIGGYYNVIIVFEKGAYNTQVL